MKTLLLALSIAALGTPAFAQTAYEDEAPVVQEEPVQPEIDDTTTGSIQIAPADENAAGLNNDDSLQRGNQSEFFGANGR